MNGLHEERMKMRAIAMTCAVALAAAVSWGAEPAPTGLWVVSEAAIEPKQVFDLTEDGGLDWVLPNVDRRKGGGAIALAAAQGAAATLPSSRQAGGAAGAPAAPAALYQQAADYPDFTCADGTEHAGRQTLKAFYRNDAPAVRIAVPAGSGTVTLFLGVSPGAFDAKYRATLGGATTGNALWGRRKITLGYTAPRADTLAIALYRGGASNVGIFAAAARTGTVKRVEPTVAAPPPPMPEGLVNLAVGRPVAAKGKDNSERPAPIYPVLDPKDLLTDKYSTGGCHGWRIKDKDLPVVYANPGASPASFLNGAIRIPPKAVAVHPGPDRDVAIGWRSPVGGTVSVKAKVTHGHARGGSDGVSVTLFHETRAGRKPLVQGQVSPGGSLTLPTEQNAAGLAAVAVAPGDGLRLLVAKRDHHNADTAIIEWTISEAGGAKRVWDLAADVAADIHAGNPHADSHGNAGIWHFLAPSALHPPGQLAAHPWSAAQLVDGVRVVGGYSCDPVYDGPEVDEWVEIDLGADRAFSAVKLYPIWAHSRSGQGAPGFPVDYTVAAKPDGGAYVTVKAVTGQVNPGIAPVTVRFARRQARHVKIAVTKVSEPAAGETKHALRLAEVEVLGQAAAESATKAAPPAVPQPHWRLRTDDTAVTVAVIDHRPVICDLRNPRQGWNWTASPVAIPLPSHVKVAGAKDIQPATWKFLNAVEDAKDGKTVTLAFACDQAEHVLFTCAWWAAAGPGPVQYSESIRSKDGKAVSLGAPRESLDLKVKSDRHVVLWRFHKDAGAPAVARSLFHDLLADGSRLEAPLNQGGQGSGFGFIPLLALDSADHGLYVGYECQGGRLVASASGSHPVTVQLEAGASPAGSGGSLPSVYIGAYRGDVDDGCNGLKRWFYAHKVPENIRKDPTEPWTQFAAMWTRKPGWSHWQEVFAQGMKEKLSDVGIESVCIDNGWWPDRKPDQWIGDPVRWPDGMAVAGKLAHENGFKLTLYFLLRGGGDYVKRLHEAMTAYGVDTYRSDFGAPSLALLDALKAVHPNFRHEHCSGGAPGKDFAMARRATVMFGIDIYDTLSNRKMFHTSSYCLPPAQIQSPIDVLSAPPAFALRSAMQGAFDIGIGTHGGKLVMPSDYPVLIEPARENLALYKTRLRPLIREANLYHLFLRPDGVDWDGLQYYSPAGRKGAVLLFKQNSKVDTRRIVLKGLDRQRRYGLSFQDRMVQNTRKTGAELMDDGFDVTMAGQFVSEIVWIQAEEDRSVRQGERR